MADLEANAKRVAGLTKLFHAVVSGRRDLKSLADGNRFLEALCVFDETSKCIENLVASQEGLNGVAKAFRFSADTEFLNGPATSVLRYLSHPSAKQLYGGQFLQRVLEQIVQPPTFWNTLIDAHDAGALSPSATHAFAWLLLELLHNRSEDALHVNGIAERLTKDESLVQSDNRDVRNLGYKIKHLLDSSSSNPENGPGGRHDNDFNDFRKIKILPTQDEFASTVEPFYRRAHEVQSIDTNQRGFVHLDNQFRLLREDFLGELRSDFQIATGQKKGRKKTVLEDLRYAGIDCGIGKRRKPCSLKLQCMKDIPQLQRLPDIASRLKYLNENKNILKHQSLGCLVSSGDIIAFASVERNESLLAKQPPILILSISEASSFVNVLKACKRDQDLHFVQVDTAIFAYEPILKRLQSMNELPLEEQVLNLFPSASAAVSGIHPTKIIEILADAWDTDLRSAIGTSQPIRLDRAQLESLLSGLSKRLSLIQGPPGTGKSFLGALIAKILHDHTNEKMLVLSYTNHALDQTLEDIHKAGVPADAIVRLGGKFNSSTQAFSLAAQPNNYRRSHNTNAMINACKEKAESYQDALSEQLKAFEGAHVNDDAILEYLEFSDDSEYFDAFLVPVGEEGMIRVGKRKNKQVERSYLIKRWSHGGDPGMFVGQATQSHHHIWNIELQARMNLRSRWVKEIIEEQVAGIGVLLKNYNDACIRLHQLFREKDFHAISQKRIIGCTTTAAAKYTDELQKASPGIILVEEAGEILESHILTAMTPTTKQVILIGDHKQLRPKVNNYNLTTEKGEGFDLNVSLFERLVLAKVPHTTLNKQHRMRPEVSALVRSLTYPELEDAEKTQGRPKLRGFQNNVIFVSHTHPELNADRVADRRDEGAKTSKENQYEADMVLKCVRYLGQQGYTNDNIVVLTPYLGQLYLLVKTLSRENDPILNDLDSHELIRAGLLSPAGANINKRRIRISTIDNYQGEESDIVIACLTRSNSEGDIGFMSAPQRVNVLLSRARNALVMIGNADTFMKSRKGSEVWVPLMKTLKDSGYVYDGFPVKCEQHPEKKALLTKKEHFDSVCPDGGCSEPCAKLLNCATHTCPHRCHQLQNHSKMLCKAIITNICTKGHKSTRKCHDKAAVLCRKCEDEAHAAQKRRQREHELEQKRQTAQQVYAAKLAEIEDEIEHQKRVLKDRADELNRQNALSQKRLDLSNLQNRASHTVYPSVNAPASQDKPTSTTRSSHSATAAPRSPSPQSPTPSQDSASSPDGSDTSWTYSKAKGDWEEQKSLWGAENEAMDSLMSMIGLETVKEKFLAIKNKVDLLVRQGVSLKGERLGAALLGNPGTGKTTVARLYAKFLVKVGALPGDHFFESSGSSLANEGITACKSHIDKILQAGGGVFFIDEAYQLVSGNSFGGKAVMDYLLAEIENLTGRVVFVLAGYHKQMEAFFAHNPGIPSRIPIQMEFEDYEDQELQQIFCHYLNTKYKCAMKVEDGLNGLYVRIVARRIGRGRGRDGFGNAREVQNKISQITERQAKRLRNDRKAGALPDDNLLTKEDLIGPEPSAVLKVNPAWLRLQKLIGLASVKQSVQALLDGIQFNYRRELEEKPLVQYSLNRCFIGSPGTGKTSVAKLYGRILADIGLLSNGEVVVKNPADFVGSVLGGSEANTKGILASTVGKVLIIDEAYMLATAGAVDPYKVAVIDTIVAEVQSTPGEDRCVLLLGYKDQMEEMFRDVNPGLARRFPLQSAFVFEDFNDEEIRQILDLKLKDIGFNATDQAKKVAMSVIQRARNRPNFGNAGEVDIILDRAKATHQEHMTAGKVKDFDTFEAIDFDPEFDRGERAATNIHALFQDVVGCEDLIKQFQGYQIVAANMTEMGMDPRDQLPFNFLFKGPPGTGKTTTAQKMGKVFYDMGLLSQAKVEQCSATDMIGQYVGQTGPKVQKLLEKAMGKVLFIDEAYRLAEGGFATEAMDELVDCLTKPKFMHKLIVILAGYDKDMDRLMSINPGLTSRFPETVIFKHMGPSTSLDLLIKVFQDFQKRKSAPLDLGIFTPPSAQLKERIFELFTKLAAQDSWGNARDVRSLAKNMFGKLLSTARPPIVSLVVTETLIIDSMESMLQERSSRSESVGTTRFPQKSALLPSITPQQELKVGEVHVPQNATSMAKPPTQAPATQLAPLTALGQDKEKEEVDVCSPELGTEEPRHPLLMVRRDAGVSDEVWEQLERDKHDYIVREKNHQRMQEEKRREEARIADMLRAERAAADEEERRVREQQRIAAELERRRKEAVFRALEEEREKEKKTQARIRQLGPCPMGYQWIKQYGGYRCAGGSHWLDDAMIGA